MVYVFLLVCIAATAVVVVHVRRRCPGITGRTPLRDVPTETEIQREPRDPVEEPSPGPEVEDVDSLVEDRMPGSSDNLQVQAPPSDPRLPLKNPVLLAKVKLPWLWKRTTARPMVCRSRALPGNQSPSREAEHLVGEPTCPSRSQLAASVHPRLRLSVGRENESGFWLWRYLMTGGVGRESRFFKMTHL